MPSLGAMESFAKAVIGGSIISLSRRLGRTSVEFVHPNNSGSGNLSYVRKLPLSTDRKVHL